MDDDRIRWDRRYAGAALAEPRPPDAIVEGGVLDVVERQAGGGRLLDVACGLGPVARWGVGRGMDVVALDVSSTAIELLNDCPEAEWIDARRVDLDQGLPDDLGRFDLVVCQRFRDPRIIESLPDHVAAGGVLAVTVLSQVGADSPGPFHAPPGDLEDHLGPACADWQRLHLAEADGEASFVARRPRAATDTGSARHR